MVCPLSLHGITDDQDQKKNCRSDKFQVGRLYDPHGNNESDTRFIENCACDNSGGCLQLSEAVEQLCSENHARETEDHGSGSDRDVEERLLLGEHSACKSGESVGDRKADDLYPAFVFCQRCNKSIIVTGCPEQISGSRI